MSIKETILNDIWVTKNFQRLKELFSIEFEIFKPETLLDLANKFTELGIQWEREELFPLMVYLSKLNIIEVSIIDGEVHHRQSRKLPNFRKYDNTTLDHSKGEI